REETPRVSWGTQDATARSSQGAIQGDPRPIARQQAASTAMGAIMLPGDSWACSARAVRGAPRKTAPETLTKQASANAPTSANAGAAKAPAVHAGIPSEGKVRKRPR